IADRASRSAHGFGVALLLAVAYGASVGGMATPVGTPPNLIAMSALEARFPEGPTLNFVEWSFRALPAVVLIIPILWLALTRVYPRVPISLDLGAGPVIRREITALGAWRPSEVRALAVFGVAAILWVTRPDIRVGDAWTIPGWAGALGVKGASDATVALLAAVLAFSLPAGDESAKPGERLLPWETAMKAPWGLVLLFGGGVALAKGFEKTGLSAYLGEALAQLVGAGLIPFISLSALAATFGTEIISNTALANITMPILAATAEVAAIDARSLLVPVAMACSCAFMMPAATGPNAIVFGTGKVRIQEMVRAGFLINLLAWAVIVVVTISLA
ncbi:MAG: SLC13 family permease, partial [Myxococcota bacterium]